MQNLGSNEGKKALVYVCFILFSIIFVGIVFALTSKFSMAVSDQSYSSWLIISYLAGLSMIILPCTLPFAFVIVPMSMNNGYKKGLATALLFGAGMTVTLTLYGTTLGYLGKATGLNQIYNILMLIAGIISYVYGLHRLKIVNIHMPSYSGIPKFVEKGGDYSKPYLMGMLVGNAGVGCTNPLFYMMLIYIMGTGSAQIGASLGFVHGVGRAIPLILIAILAMLGFNPLTGLAAKRDKLERVSGVLLVIIGSFLIINGIPEGQQWYMQYISHGLWNDVVNMLHLPKELSLGMMPGETMQGMSGMTGMSGMDNMSTEAQNTSIPMESIPIIIAILIGSPFAWYFIHGRKKTELYVMKDLVCGMEVKEKKYSTKHNGKEYLFCCAHCKTTFENNPKQFVKE
ncbi:MAG TPA: cytochrome c biogenesis protein CcdA [Candidatus Bathyarchaeia archaeon]|nr:cytochrome c biogenesis protein CcdA [Candidatus Bathyarchaeia archaeon]